MKDKGRSFHPPRLTTTQRNALSAIDGMMIYNTTTAKYNLRQAGEWIEFDVNAYPLNKLDIDGGTDVGGALADTDLIIVDKGANGTNRKSAMSRVWTYISSKLTGAISTVITSNFNTDRVIVSNVSGKLSESNVTSTELSLLSGKTSIGTAISGIVRKTATESVVSSTTLQDDDHLFFNVEANSTYLVTLYILHNGQGVHSNFKIGTTVPMLTIATSMLMHFSRTYNGTSITTDSSINAGDALFSEKVIATNAGANNMSSLIYLYVRTAANSGTFKFQWAQNSSSSTAMQVAQDSYLEWRKL